MLVLFLSIPLVSAKGLDYDECSDNEDSSFFEKIFLRRIVVFFISLPLIGILISFLLYGIFKLKFKIRFYDKGCLWVP